MPVELPVEIFGVIVGFLARPVLLYGYPPPVLRALHQLCLVSHFVHGAAAPFLYRSIAIRSPAGLNYLHRTRADENSFASSYPTTSLSIHPGAITSSFLSHRIPIPTDDNAMEPPAVPRLITSIRSLPTWTLLVGLITFSHQSLQRLSFDVPLAHKSFRETYTAHKAIAECPHIHELTTTTLSPGDTFINAIAHWPYLHHLALDGSISSSELISIATAIPSLTHLLLLACASHKTAHDIIRASRTLRRLIIIYGSERVLLRETLRLAEYTHKWGSDVHVTQVRFGHLGQLWDEFGMPGGDCPSLPRWLLVHALPLDSRVVVGTRWDVGGS